MVVLFPDKNNLHYQSVKFVIPSLITFILTTKWLTIKYVTVCKYVFPGFVLFFGMILSIENTFFDRFRLYEIWLMYYFFCFLISVTHCFDWKRIVLAFWVVKAFYVCMMYKAYGVLTFQFYAGIVYACSTYPIVSMLATTKIIDLLRLIQKNKTLITMIKHVLKSFPEAVLIQEFDEETLQPVVKFVNDVAASELLTYPFPENKPIDDSLLDFQLREASENNEPREDEEFPLSQLLKRHVDKLGGGENEVVTHIEILKEEEVDEQIVDRVQKCYSLKSIKVNWEESKAAFLHSFINTTYTVKLEKERAVNECLQTMFRSVSHEFRTPINAFANALLLISSNNDTLQNLISEIKFENGDL